MWALRFQLRHRIRYSFPPESARLDPLMWMMDLLLDLHYSPILHAESTFPSRCYE